MKSKILMLFALLFTAFLPIMAEPNPDIEHQEATLRSLQEQFEALKNFKSVTPTTEKAVLKVDKLEQVVVTTVSTNSDLPKEIQELHRRRVDSFSEMNRLHVKLPYLQTDDERFLAAAKIISLEAENHACWRNIHLYNETGKLPNEVEKEKIQELADLSALELGKKMRSARSYISKNKDNPNKITQVNERKELIVQIETILG